MTIKKYSSIIVSSDNRNRLIKAEMVDHLKNNQFDVMSIAESMLPQSDSYYQMGDMLNKYAGLIGLMFVEKDSCNNIQIELNKTYAGIRTAIVWDAASAESLNLMTLPNIVCIGTDNMATPKHIENIVDKVVNKLVACE